MDSVFRANSGASSGVKRLFGIFLTAALSLVVPQLAFCQSMGIYLPPSVPGGNSMVIFLNPTAPNSALVSQTLYNNAAAAVDQLAPGFTQQELDTTVMSSLTNTFQTLFSANGSMVSQYVAAGQEQLAAAQSSGLLQSLGVASNGGGWFSDAGAMALNPNGPLGMCTEGCAFGQQVASQLGVDAFPIGVQNAPGLAPGGHMMLQTSTGVTASMNAPLTLDDGSRVSVFQPGELPATPDGVTFQTLTLQEGADGEMALNAYNMLTDTPILLETNFLEVAANVGMDVIGGMLNLATQVMMNPLTLILTNPFPLNGGILVTAAGDEIIPLSGDQNGELSGMPAPPAPGLSADGTTYTSINANGSWSTVNNITGIASGYSYAQDGNAVGFVGTPITINGAPGNTYSVVCSNGDAGIMGTSGNVLVAGSVNSSFGINLSYANGTTPVVTQSPPTPTADPDAALPPIPASVLPGNDNASTPSGSAGNDDGGGDGGGGGGGCDSDFCGGPYGGDDGDEYESIGKPSNNPIAKAPVSTFVGYLVLQEANLASTTWQMVFSGAMPSYTINAVTKGKAYVVVVGNYSGTLQGVLAAPTYFVNVSVPSGSTGDIQFNNTSTGTFDILLPEPANGPMISSVTSTGSASGAQTFTISGSNFGASGNMLTLNCGGVITSSLILGQSSTTISGEFGTSSVARSCQVSVTYSGLTSPLSSAMSIPAVTSPAPLGPTLGSAFTRSNAAYYTSTLYKNGHNGTSTVNIADAFLDPTYAIDDDYMIQDGLSSGCGTNIYCPTQSAVLWQLMIFASRASVTYNHIPLPTNCNGVPSAVQTAWPGLCNNFQAVLNMAPNLSPSLASLMNTTAMNASVTGSYGLALMQAVSTSNGGGAGNPSITKFWMTDNTHNTISGSTITVSYGDSLTFNWTTTNALSLSSNCSIPGPALANVASGTYYPGVGTYATFSCTLTATGSAGTTPATATVNVTVTPPPANPVITKFSVSDLTHTSISGTNVTVDYGDGLNLVWTTTNAVSLSSNCSIPGGALAQVASGSYYSGIGAMSSYNCTLTATGNAGTTPASATVTITVLPKPVVTSLTYAEPAAYYGNGTYTIKGTGFQASGNTVALSCAVTTNLGTQTITSQSATQIVISAGEITQTQNCTATVTANGNASNAETQSLTVNPMINGAVPNGLVFYSPNTMAVYGVGFGVGSGDSIIMTCGPNNTPMSTSIVAGSMLAGQVNFTFTPLAGTNTCKVQVKYNNVTSEAQSISVP